MTRFAALVSVCSLFSLAVGCASPSAGDDGELSEQPLVSDIPEDLARDYAVDENAVYARASVGGQVGLFRFPVGAGAPAFLDGYNASRTRTYVGFEQVIGDSVYYVVGVYDDPTNRYAGRRELWRAPTAGGAPVKVMAVPSGRIIVAKTLVYVVTEGNDHYGDISAIDLGGTTPRTVATGEYFARDFVTVGDALYWRSDWAGLSDSGLKLRAFDPSSGARTIDLGPARHELQRVLVDGDKVYALGDWELWSLDAATGAVSAVPPLRDRMASAGVSYCGDEYPYGNGSSIVRAGKLYVYCTNWDDRSKRFILSFGLTDGTVNVVKAVPTTRAWHFRASQSRLFWLEKTGHDRYAVRTAAL